MTLTPFMRPDGALLGLVGAAMLAFGGCGAGDALPPREIPPPAVCPPVDDYLATLNATIATGAAEGLATVVRERFADDTRRDFVDSAMRILKAFEPGVISALAPDRGSPESEPGVLQPTLARLVRLLLEPAPRVDVYALGRGILATCDGGPMLTLLADLSADVEFIDAAVRLVASPGLREALADLSFEQEQGREALRYLIRNVLVAATQDTFSLETITGLLGLLVDLDAPPYDNLVRGLETVLDGPGLETTRQFLVCVQRVDTELTLGAFVHDLLNSDVFSEVGRVFDRADFSSDSIQPLMRVLSQALAHLGQDGITRRGFANALVVLLQPDNATPALSGVAALLESGALSGVIDLVLDLVTGACRR